MLPLYQRDQHQFPNGRPPTGAHRGLWFERFFDRYTDNADGLESDQAKQGWIGTVQGPNGNRGDLQRHAHQIIALAKACKGHYGQFTNDWRFATGLGLPHPVENGFAWHPVLAVPYLPGAAVKGLVRAYVEQWTDLPQAQIKARLKSWFGSESKNSKAMEAGWYVFFDALPTDRPTLVADVMTPHMGNWYESGDVDPGGPDNTPADWHDPVPVPFLVVKEVKFLFAIGVRPNLPEMVAKQAMAELEEMWEVLINALDWLGAGAKTAVGYGHMAAGNDKEHDTLEKSFNAYASKLKTALASRTEERLATANSANQDEIDQAIEAVLQAEPNKNQSDTITLMHAIKAGKWEGEEQMEVIHRLKKRMETKREWKPTSNAKKPEKDKNHRRTLEVIAWLQETK